MFPLLFLLLIIFPIAELYVIIKIGEAIGLLPTLALLIVDGFIGAALARSQGRAVVARFQQAMNEGRLPAKEAFDGAMVAIGGAFLLAPGFITDAIGLLLLIPPSRAVIRGMISRSMAKRRASVRFGMSGGPRPGGPRPGPGAGQAPPPGWQPPGGAGPFGRRRPDYDFEGTAQEVTDPAPELENGDDSDRPGGEERRDA